MQLLKTWLPERLAEGARFCLFFFFFGGGRGFGAESQVSGRFFREPCRKTPELGLVPVEKRTLAVTGLRKARRLIKGPSAGGFWFEPFPGCHESSSDFR